MKTLYKKFVQGMEKLHDLTLLLFRIILAIGFYSPAMMKVKNLEGVAEWFGSMSYPFPLVSAILAMTTEVLGIVLLTLGFGTRVIALPMMCVMVVALVVYGSGKFSLDYVLGRRSEKAAGTS